MKHVRIVFWNIYYRLVKPKSLTESMIRGIRLNGGHVTNIKLSKTSPSDFTGSVK